MNGPFTISPQQNTSSIQINDKINFTLNLINPLLSSNQLKINNTNSINKFPIFNYFDVNYFNLLFQNYKLLISSNQNLSKSNINNKEVESRKNNYFLVGKKKKRNSKLCENCPHTSAPHYAKGMCSNCYHSKGRSKKPWNCVHVNKAHYALGLCQNCYQMAYIKKNLESKSFKGDNIILNDKKNVFEKKDDSCVNNIKEKSIDDERTLNEN